jgi:hypothetical protein
MWPKVVAVDHCGGPGGAGSGRWPAGGSSSASVPGGTPWWLDRGYGKKVVGHVQSRGGRRCTESRPECARRCLTRSSLVANSGGRGWEGREM